ncbi:flavin reductase family protein [Nocardioides sp. NBC_00368]|uniref:flavin reductase family protein n=1 Tax=Nocardioides sp. NBC_00368 TaxID=2976000 RepID=UPI002E22C289
MGTHVDIDPAILYFGTPVVVLSTLNEDGSTNLMPMSSVFWLGRTAVLGMGASSQTARNLRERPEIVLNLPSVDLVTQVDRLALTTGNAAMSAAKAERGYVHVADKYAHAGLTAYGSDTVLPTSVAECPVHIEGTISAIHELGEPKLLAVEVAVTAVRVMPRTPRGSSQPDRSGSVAAAGDELPAVLRAGGAGPPVAVGEHRRGALPLTGAGSIHPGGGMWVGST